MIEWLGRNDYVVKKAKTLSEHGEDIKARKARSSNYIIVEVKGDPPGKNADKTRQGFFVSALGEIIQRVKHEHHYRYTIAFPETYREMVARRIPWAAAKKLGLEILLVDEKGQIERLTWMHLKKSK